MVEDVKTPSQRTRVLTEKVVAGYIDPEKTYGRFTKQDSFYKFDLLEIPEIIIRTFEGKGIDFIISEITLHQSEKILKKSQDDEEMGEVYWHDKYDPLENGMTRADAVTNYLELCRNLGRELR